MTSLRWLALVSLSLASACGSAEDADAGAPLDGGASVDAGSPSDAGALEDAASPDAALDAGAPSDGGASGCSPSTLEACRYAPETPLAQLPTRTAIVSYTDATGAIRRLEVAIREPDGALGPLPVVVYSHGGADGTASADGVGAAWSRVFTRAGYLFVAIAHRGRDATERMVLCTHLGLDADGCMRFKYLNWDRPHDVRAVLDWIESDDGALADLADPSRLAYMGHSAGAGSAMMVAGATRQYGDSVQSIPDPRPVAFIACSPQGPGTDDFVDDSFDAIARPVLVLSSQGDDTSGVVAETRREPFSRMLPGDKYLGWIADESARHTTNNLETAACVSYANANDLDAARCELFLEWHASAGLAFMDAYVRDDPAAHAYLASDALEILSGGAMEWSSR